MTESHTEGFLEGQFCSQRKDTCDCPTGSGNKYKDLCQPDSDWGKYPQKYTQSVKDGGALVEQIHRAVRRAHEAHHIACVASVTKIITKNTALQPIVHNTPWCVNKAENVIALPLWAHTIQWYCGLSIISPSYPEILKETLQGGWEITPAGEPPFKNLPQHDYDHGAYIEEVDGALEDLVATVQGVEGHQEQQDTLRSELDTLVSDFKGELQRRGQRVGGTHAAWNLGMNFPESEWYLPFSMADDGEADPRAFPSPLLGSKTTMAQKIMEVALAFWQEANPISVLL